MGTALARRSGFDYTDFDQELHAKLLRIAETVNTSRCNAMDALMTAAAEVYKAHAILSCAGRGGRFSSWVKEECHFSESTAYRLIDIHKLFGDFDHVAQIEDSALRRLADSGTPEDVIAKAKRAAKKGSFVDLEWVKEEVANWKAANVEEDDEDDDPVGTEYEEIVDASEEEDEGTDAGARVDHEDRDRTHLAPLDFAKWGKAIQKLRDMVDEYATGGNVGDGDRMGAHDLLQELDETVRGFGG
jgi:hypothetical protein